MKLKMINQIYLLLLLCLITNSIQVGIQPNEKPQQVDNKDKPQEKLSAQLTMKVIKNNTGTVKKELKMTDTGSTKTNSTIKPFHDKTENIKVEDSAQTESGAVIRGVFLVCIGISIIFIYLVCKVYRKKKSHILIKKYGVRTRRSDVEMTPLPLDDEDEDETVFDVGNLNKP